MLYVYFADAVFSLYMYQVENNINSAAAQSVKQV